MLNHLKSSTKSNFPQWAKPLPLRGSFRDIATTSAYHKVSSVTLIQFHILRPLNPALGAAAPWYDLDLKVRGIASVLMLTKCNSKPWILVPSFDSLRPVCTFLNIELECFVLKLQKFYFESKQNILVQYWGSKSLSKWAFTLFKINGWFAHTSILN